MICERCNQIKPDVCERLDPYDLEINEEENLITVCDQCYEEIADDI